MPEIQRGARREFKRVAGGRDVFQVRNSAQRTDEAPHGLGLEIAQRGGIAFQGFEKLFVADERDFHGLHVTGAFVARRKRGE